LPGLPPLPLLKPFFAPNLFGGPLLPPFTMIFDLVGLLLLYILLTALSENVLLEPPNFCLLFLRSS
jgi:hypothetical protein